MSNFFNKQKQKKVEPGHESGKNVETASYKQYAEKIKDGHVIDLNKAILFGSVLGIMAIVMFYQMVSTVSPSLGVVLLFLGMAGFLPLGIIIGKFLLDPYIRCKLLRKMRQKNYGMVYFVYKGGQRVDIKIKNLDSDVVVVEDETKIWVLEKGSIYYVTREDEKIFHSTIKGKNVVTTPQDVPVVFLDAESMLPLNFNKRETETNPQQAGASLLGYVQNQIAKNNFFKHTDTFFYLMVIGLCFANFVGMVMMYDALVGF